MRFLLPAVLHDESRMRQWKNGFEPTMAVVPSVKLFKILFSTNAISYTAVNFIGKQPFHVPQNEWRNGLQERFIVVIIQIFAVSYKAQGTNRGNKKTGIKGADASIGLDHFVNEFSRKFGPASKGMLDRALRGQLLRCCEIYTCDARTE